MGAVASFVGDVVGDVVEVVGDVAEDVVQVAGDAVEDVGSAVGDVVEGALEDPIGTMATVAAIATQQYYLLPAISAGKVVANGGDLDDALKAAAITYVAGEVGGAVGDQVSTAAQYGTELGSAQTAMLAAQNAGMGMGTALGGAAGAAAGAGTGALLSGGDVGQAIVSGLAGYGTRLGMNLGTNALGQVVNEVGDVVADSYDQLEAMMGEEYGDQPGDYPTTPEDLAVEDAFLGQTADQPGDFPTTEQDLALEDELMGQVGDQPGDYDTTPEEVAASEEILGGLPSLDEAPVGDQEGDFPLNEEERALADEELGRMPAAEEYADQPGDYDTTAEEMAASEQALSEIPDSSQYDFEVNTEGLKDYGKNLFKNALMRNVFGKSMSSGVKTPGNLISGLSFAGLQSDGGEEDVSENEAVVTPNSTSELDLFNATGDMSWAPQTKIGGLGTSGKYVNQEQDTYFMDPEQARREQALKDRESGFGWDTNFEEPEDSLENYYNYQPNDFSNPTYDQSYFAEGGSIPGHNPEFFSEGGLGNRYVKGDGDGTSDSVPAMLASGEFVIPADVVSSLGNGDNDAGAQTLDEFMMAIRKHKRAAAPNELPEDSKGPLAYLQEALTKARK